MNDDLLEFDVLCIGIESELNRLRDKDLDKVPKAVEGFLFDIERQAADLFIFVRQHWPAAFAQLVSRKRNFSLLISAWIYQREHFAAWFLHSLGVESEVWARLPRDEREKWVEKERVYIERHSELDGRDFASVRSCYASWVSGAVKFNTRKFRDDLREAMKVASVLIRDASLSPSTAAKPRTPTKAKRSTEPGKGRARQPSLSGPESPTGFLGGAELADALGVHASRHAAFFRQLGRMRKSLGDSCWQEVREPRPNSPKFLYRVDSSRLRDLAAKYAKPQPE